MILLCNLKLLHLAVIAKYLICAVSLKRADTHIIGLALFQLREGIAGLGRVLDLHAGLEVLLG